MNRIPVAIASVLLAGLLLAFPRELLLATAGIALLDSTGGGLHPAPKEDAPREAPLIPFLVALSGLTLGGVGPAFWGAVAGAIALLVQQYGIRKTDPL